MNADFVPLIDRPNGAELIGLIDIAHQKLECQTFGTSLFQQPAGFGPGFLNVGPETCQLFQFLLRRGQRRAGKHDPADSLQDRDFRERRAAAPLIDRQQQCPPHSHVIERFARGIGRYQIMTIPIAGLHRHRGTKFAHQGIARGRRETAKFDRRAITPESRRPAPPLSARARPRTRPDKAGPRDKNLDCASRSSTGQSYRPRAGMDRTP